MSEQPPNGAEKLTGVALLSGFRRERGRLLRVNLFCGAPEILMKGMGKPLHMSEVTYA